MEFQTAKKVLSSVLAAAPAPERPAAAFLLGPPGVGKTALVRDAAAAIGASLAVVTPGLYCPEDFRGYPLVVDGAPKFSPYSGILAAVNGPEGPEDRPHVVLLDDVGQAADSVQAAVMHLVFSRRLGEVSVPPKTRFVLASNRSTDSAGVRGVLSPLITRSAVVLDVRPSWAEWAVWAASQPGIAPEVPAYLRACPAALIGERPPRGGSSGYPCPRSWEAVGRLLPMLPKDIAPGETVEVLRGLLGEEEGGRFAAFLSLVRSCPPPADIFRDPANAPLPQGGEGVALAYAAVLARAAGLDGKKREAAKEYLGRVSEEAMEAAIAAWKWGGDGNGR